MTRLRKKPLPSLADISKQDFPKYYKQGTSTFTMIISENQALQVRLLKTQTTVTMCSNVHLIDDAQNEGVVIDAVQFSNARKEALKRIEP